MNIIKLNPHDYPLEKGESWWVVNLNRSDVEFSAPVGAIAFCEESLMSFKQGTVYQIVNNDMNTGWITLMSHSEIVEMPHYIFARYFDAEAFVRGIVKDPSLLERATPFDYKSTLPCKPYERHEG